MREQQSSNTSREPFKAERFGELNPNLPRFICVIMFAMRTFPDTTSKPPIALIMGYLQAMGSARFVATAAQLFLFATLCTAKPQGFQTTGKLVCILGPTVSTTSSAKNEKGAYGLVLQVKGDVYRCMEKRQGLLRRRRFRERDWPLGTPVQVLVDEGRGEVYIQDQRKHRKEVVLRCPERVSLKSWGGCVTEH
jgi:hypothetical protein